MQRLIGFLVLTLALLIARQSFAAEPAEQLQRTSEMFANFAYQAAGIICTQPLARNILVDRAHWQMSADLDCGPSERRVTYLVSWTRGKPDVQPDDEGK